jgi:hypothetical protein
VQFTEADKFASEVPVLFTIGPPPGQHRDNDIAAGFGAVIAKDRIGSTPGLTLTVTPVSVASGTPEMNIAIYWDSGLFRSTTVISAADVTNLVPKVIDFSEDHDLAVHFYFTGGIDGSFTLAVNDDTNLVPPPVVFVPDVEWVPLFPGGGSGGDEEWLDLTSVLAANWRRLGDSASHTIRARKAHGIVRLEGYLERQTSTAAEDTTIMTLPVGWRPVKPIIGSLIFCRNGSLNTNGWAAIDIGIDGVVKLRTSSFAYASGVWSNLGDISFPIT